MAARSADRQVYTTGEIAVLFGVAAGTVSKWIDRGLLKGFRIPGSMHRRVTYAALEAFAREHAGYALDRLSRPEPADGERDTLPFTDAG